MAQYQIPLELAYKVRRLQGSPEWEALLEYLAFREGQLNDLLYQDSEDDREIVKRVMKTLGGKTEIQILRNLPGVAEEICQISAKKAEFEAKRRT